MSLDIGEAFSEGISRTVAKNGLLLAVVFAVVALLTTVLFQTFLVGLLEAILEFMQSASTSELGIPQSEYDQALEQLRNTAQQTRQTSPLALNIPAGVAAAGLLVLAIVSEAVSIVAIRVFATDETETMPRDLTTRNIVLATLNGFIGGIVVSALILVGFVFLIIPGIFLAVAFYFLRQEIALNDKNFVQAMADSWRVTKGHRITVFALALVLVLIAQLEAMVGSAFGELSPLASALVTPVVGGILGVFGAAVVTRAYVQLQEPDLEAEPETSDEQTDPYDAALGADDIPE
ncbi:MAG: hypothetical protein ACI8UR_002189 [Natronomonas sp.]|jgi:hypothetical protein|uniref:hypothetical protein n=2 Tax=Natronomonas sp. TaxID=2184060 RepID=UPI0039E4F605